MIRRHVLAALADGVDAGHEDAARAALARTEWLLRGRARRRLERALIDASLATGESDTFHDPEAARHVQRVAALALGKRRLDDPSDRSAVQAAYDTLPVATVPRGPRALLAVMAAATLAIAATIVVWPDPPHRRGARVAEGYVRPLPPPVAGAYEHGGVPLRDESLEQLLVGPFTALVIESDRDREHGGIDRDRAEHAAAVERDPAIARHGAALTAAWSDLLAMLDRWVHVPMSSRDFDDVARELRAKVRVISDQLAAAGLGYYLEGTVLTGGSGAHAVIRTYRVEQVVYVHAGPERRRVLSLRRLDRLNLSHALLGMQSEELGDPVVLLDQIDEHVATAVLPVLAPGTPYPFGDDWPDGAPLANAAGDAIRGELARALGPDARAASDVGRLLAKRERYVEGWRTAIDRRGLVMARTDALYLPPGLLDDLARYVPASELDAVGELETELQQLGAERIAARCHDLVTATVRRHEAQHGLDDDRALGTEVEPLRYPPPLAALLGDELDAKGDPRPHVERARAELSGYLSQIANDPATPQLALWHLARHVFAQRGWGSAESYAGVVILEGLARQLDMPLDRSVVERGRIDRARLVPAAVAIAKLPTDRLRAAARSLWVELYDEPFVAITE
ncbi:MAG TPA: hypothetical protein VFQ53_21535 [Kofleriaceae bacterium]|nr:hypothetical protein [Kofleriaceae bacterium]